MLGLILLGLVLTLTPMRRATALVGLAILTWFLVGSGIFLFWTSTSAKRSLSERVAAGEPLERWVLTQDEWASLDVVDGEFWMDGRIYDVMTVDSSTEGAVVIQVFDDSYETQIAKMGRKLLRRHTKPGTELPSWATDWASLRFVPSASEYRMQTWPVVEMVYLLPLAEGEVVERAFPTEQPPEGGRTNRNVTV